MRLAQTRIEIQRIKDEIEFKGKEHKKQIDDLKDKLQDALIVEAVELQGINYDIIEKASEIIKVRGKVFNNCEGQVIAELAATDIANGCKHLKTEFFGNKQYDGFYQRCDCDYGYGPRHGSIVEEVELRKAYRDRDLTAEETEACIYYLLNYRKIFEAAQTVKMD